MPSQTFDIFRQAVISRSQVLCFYRGYQRECCPHILGYTSGHEQALSFQFAGGSSSDLPIGGQWRCMDLSEVSRAQLRDGPWHTDLRHSRPQSCVKQIDVGTS